jgi:hypothetical protein
MHDINESYDSEGKFIPRRGKVMPTGFSNEQMMHLILEGQQGIQKQLALLVEKVDNVTLKGCAHRQDDLRRIEELEGWRTKGIIGIIGLAISTAIAFITGHK